MTIRRPVIPLLDARATHRHADAVEDADDGLARPTRRSVVQWLAASMALAASGCTRTPTERIHSYARMPEIEVNGSPMYHASACLHDGFAHGVLVASQQGRPVKIEGNPEHPASLGGTSVFSQAAILQLWDPDRSNAVWHRDAEGHAAPSTWAAFDAAWRTQAARGGPLHLLTPRFTSPTFAARLATLLQQHPGSRWYLDDAGGGDTAAAGAVAAFGRPVRAIHHFDRADLIVSFGGDPFRDAAAGVRQAADWSSARALAVSAGKRPPRVVALETTPGLFGARADERQALAPHHVEAALWRAAASVIGTLPPSQGASGGAPGAIAERLATLFAAHPGRTVVCGGADLSLQSHALVHALNQRLAGAGVEWIAAPDRPAGLPEPGTLAELVAAMNSGDAEAVLIAGGNPAYSAAAAHGFDAALKKVRFSAHLSSHRDETSERCAWHLPCTHELEQWGDALAYDGSASFLQPAIAPLYDTRSPHEWLAGLAAGTRAPPTGHELVREQWRSGSGADFEGFWTASLRHGSVVASRAAALALPPARLPAAPPAEVPAAMRSRTPIAAAGASTLWCVFPPDASIGDGGHANNGWLQELPRPFTKITWDNALQLGPLTAASLGLKSGDVVRIDAHGSQVEAPVWVQPGHAEQAATLALGHGRTAAGRVGNGVGADTSALRATTAGPVPVTLERTGRTHAFALTQVEVGQHDRELARLVSFDEARHGRPEKALPSLYPNPPVAPVGPAWAMAIDLDSCIGCNACTIACQAENNIPVVGPDEVRQGRAMHWIRVDTYQDADAESGVAHTTTQPVPCMHCEKAPCEVVCPVGATVHDSEGLNIQVYNRCVGTRFCSNNCPYKVRRFNFRQYSDVKTETLKLMHNPDVTVRSRGVMEKCSYCVQRLSRGRRESQKTGEPLPTDTVETACQSACPTKAIHFGDLNDPKSDVVRTRASPRHYAMLGDLNTQPRTTYLARIAALPADDA